MTEIIDLQGHGVQEYAPFDGDSVSHRVTWRDATTLNALRGLTVRLKFYLRSTHLYSFAVG